MTQIDPQNHKIHNPCFNTNVSKYFIIIIIIIIMIKHIVDLEIAGIGNERLVLLLKMLNDRGDFLFTGSKRLPSAPILRICPAL